LRFITEFNFEQFDIQICEVIFMAISSGAAFGINFEREFLQFKNAKPVEGIFFGTQKNVVPMQQSSVTSASLDKQRAELARKHVRALNNQFVR